MKPDRLHLPRLMVLFAFCFIIHHSSFAIEIGVATADITPDVKTYRVPMAGYGARLGRPSTGVHDPIHAKVLYFRDGDTRMALVTTDLRSVTPQMKRQVLDKIPPQLFMTEDNLMMCASHNHSGPSIFPEKFWQMQFGKADPKVVELMTDAIADAVKRAERSAVPARVGYASAPIEGFSKNRRWEYDQAFREASGSTPCIDPTLWVMRVDAAEAANGAAPKPLAILVNFATHPTILGADNMMISAEWPGAMQDALEAEFPGATALFTNGAEGDQAPAGAIGEEAFARVKDFGTRIAAEAAKLARGVETKLIERITYNRNTPPLPEIIFSEAAQKGINKAMAAPAREALPRKAEIQSLVIGPIALVGLPGEPVCQIGHDTRQKIRAALDSEIEPVVVGLANDYVGYILTAYEYARGGYEVDSRSFYGPGLGDFISDQAARCAAGVASPRLTE